MTIDEIKLSNQQHGYYFFEPAALRFFSSRIGRSVYKGPGGVYFTTSEQFVPSSGKPEPRRYTVRQFYPETGNVESAGGFQAYSSSGAARMAALRLAKGGVR